MSTSRVKSVNLCTNASLSQQHSLPRLFSLMNVVSFKFDTGTNEPLELVLDRCDYSDMEPVFTRFFFLLSLFGDNGLDLVSFTRIDSGSFSFEIDTSYDFIARAKSAAY